MKLQRKQPREQDSATPVLKKDNIKRTKEVSQEKKCFTPKCKRKFHWVTICKWDL